MLDQIRKLLKSEYITVTDIPKDGGGYDFKPEDSVSVKDYQNASAGIMHAQNTQMFWHRLSGYVARDKVARCHGCTAYAARCLQGLATQNNKRLLICGIAASDHHVLLVTDKAQAKTGDEIQGQGNDDDIVVDLWQFNLDRQTAGAVNLEVLANYAGSHAYTSGARIRVFSGF